MSFHCASLQYHVQCFAVLHSIFYCTVKHSCVLYWTLNGSVLCWTFSRQVCPLSDDTTYIKAFSSNDPAMSNSHYSGKRGHGQCLLVGHLVDPMGRVVAVRPGGNNVLHICVMELLKQSNDISSECMIGFLQMG